jgi:fermentation-respiration switch protein FrsA (DUF1100 family)
MRRSITFDRDGLVLAGDLFTPDGFDEDGSYPAVIVQGSFTSVKEQMPSTYAAKLADEGFVALAFDYSHYGESAGEPRQLESPDDKLSDLRAAVSCLTWLPYVQAVGMVGICTSAGNAAYLAAADPRVKAMASVAGFLPGPDLYRSLYGEDGLAQRKAAAAEARRTYEETGEVVLVPAYSEDDPAAINYRPARTTTTSTRSAATSPSTATRQPSWASRSSSTSPPSARHRPSRRRRWSFTPTGAPSPIRLRSSTRSFGVRRRSWARRRAAASTTAFAGRGPVAARTTSPPDRRKARICGPLRSG